MNAPERRWPIQLFRIGSLVVPSMVAWRVAFAPESPTGLTRAVTLALGPLWVLTAIALAHRVIEALLARRRARAPLFPSALDRIDVLTASGSSLAWSGAAAIVASVWIGWASLSVVGLVGLGLLHVMVLWACIWTGGDDPFRRRSLSRRFVPDFVVEGDKVREEIRFEGARVPLGFRLFASGRVGPRWPTSRCVVEGADSGGDVLFESDLGPALRGEHDAEPLDVWLEDVFGLCRSARHRAGSARLTVLPRPRAVEGARELLGPGADDRSARAERRLPTEGSLALREYQPGDDARRIHWVRSLVAREVVVRMPDEVPRDLPSVRLVLDTFLPGARELACTSPAALLDALVEVWLGVGRALLDAGVRVTLVTAPLKDGDAKPFRARLTPQTLHEALHAGARARWQDRVRARELVVDAEPSIVVACRLPADASKDASVRWVVVSEHLWSPFEQVPPKKLVGVHSYPTGSHDNRSSRRRREQLRWDRARRDHASFAALTRDSSRPGPGTFVARRSGGRIELEAIR